ncbi:unnamed protein product [Nippostrongylus brasiliensis]|uniref:BPI2 domain-containing protein n=1 Tax=Nippostrongylus brasiliensis TaxID=27835 RepID=A0A0N4XEA1_NIPBR|nr:unnamed protein product [Nippostrongylus brasiliensis]
MLQERLRHLVIDLTLLDASATLTDFSVGMSGQVRSTKSSTFSAKISQLFLSVQLMTPMEPFLNLMCDLSVYKAVTSSDLDEVSPYRVPFPFRLPYNTQRRMVEIIISQYSVNSLLYLAHRTNSLLFHVDSRFPMIGNVLKTSCTVDEVCITDQVEEVGATYPNKKLELIIRTTQPPVVTFLKDEMRLTLEGRCLFFLEGTRQKVGVIPFSAEASIQLQTIGPLLKGKLSITRLTFTKGVEFFGLNIDDLEGLRKAAKMALENLANVIFGAGIPLTASNLNSQLLELFVEEPFGFAERLCHIC